MPTRRLALAVALSSLAACAPKPGETDADTGLLGVQLPKGALVGTWAQYVETHTLVPVQVLGDKPGGGTSTRLVTRTWDAAADQYTDTFSRCTNDIFEVLGEKTVVPEETLRKLPPSSYTSAADHHAGSWLAADTLDLWGVRDLPDPLATPLPTKDDFTAPPQCDWMWDQDEDGRPGVTVLAKGLVAARLAIVKRTVWTLDGTVVTPDRIQGLVRMTKSESSVVEATVAWMAVQGTAKADPDPLTSWFDMVRLRPGAGCDEVAAAVADGALTTVRPF